MFHMQLAQLSQVKKTATSHLNNVWGGKVPVTCARFLFVSSLCCLNIKYQLDWKKEYCHRHSAQKQRRWAALGSTLLYVHRNHEAHHRDVQPWTTTSTVTQLPSSDNSCQSTCRFIGLCPQKPDGLLGTRWKICSWARYVILLPHWSTLPFAGSGIFINNTKLKHQQTLMLS